MINEQIESISVISTSSSSSQISSSSSSSGSSSSSKSSTSSCSSGSSPPSSLLTSSSSTPKNCSMNSSLNSSLSLSMSNKSHQQQQPDSSFQVEQIAYDFGNIMSDLTNVCGTLHILAKQIDHIVHKIDDKFTFIIENLNKQSSSHNGFSSHAKAGNSCKNPSTYETINSLQQLNSLNKAKITEAVKVSGKVSTHIDTLKNKNHVYTLNYAATKPVAAASVLNRSLPKQLQSSDGCHNNSSLRPYNSRSLSDRIVIVKSGNQDRSDDQLGNFSFQNNKFEFCTAESEKCKRATENYETINYSSGAEKTSSLKRCTRSKSQPAFPKEQINVLNNHTQKTPATNQTQPKAKSLHYFDQNLVNSFGFGNNNSGEANLSLHKENSQADESSFYEDQLDNELESFSDSGQTRELNKSTLEMFGVNNKCNASSDADVANTLDKQPTNTNIKSTNKKPSRSANSNHHVSFNINNAIYTTRQEIPISIIKQQPATGNVATIVSSTSGGGQVQSSLRKSPTVQPVQPQTAVANNNNINKNGRSADTKTTIL